MTKPSTRQVLKRLARSLVPPAWRPTAYLQGLVRRQTGMRISGGPFNGMRYVATAVGSAFYPKLIGIYERELVPVVERICKMRPSHVVDIGAAEGYYAVGLLLTGAVPRVTAFEETSAGRELIGQMARANGVEGRLTVAGRCDPESLGKVLSTLTPPVVIICDVEGYEAQLMDPERVPGLERASILVELHEFAQRGISRRVRERFETTHDIEEIQETPRSSSDLPYWTPYSRLFPARYIQTVISEYRPERMNWFWMTPKAGTASPKLARPAVAGTP